MPLLFVLQDHLLLSHPGSCLLFLLVTPLTSFTFSNVHVPSGCNNIISDSTWRILTAFFFFQTGCVLEDLLCRDVTDKERGGSEPLSSVMHFPFDSTAATESYFPVFLPESALFCVQLWNVSGNTVNCENLVSLILFSLSLPSFYT